MQGPPQRSDFWAKLKYKDDDRSTGEIVAWNPLLTHSADVAAVTEALLTRTILRKRLARLAGWDDLSDVHIARLSALAAIHDAGKVNHGFQKQAFDGGGRSPGHVQPIVDVLEFPEHAQELLLPLGVGEMLGWFPSERALKHFLLATWGHHGRPVLPGGTPSSRLWQAADGRDPSGGLEELAGHVQSWFPKAYASDAEPLPTDPPFQHAYNGVLTLADWIGSDRTFFRFAESRDDPMPLSREHADHAVEQLFLDPGAARGALGAVPVGFDGVLEDPDWDPHPIQQACLGLPLHPEGSLTVLESDTGSGKTEAALARFMRLYQAGLVDGLYFAVPTRSAAMQLHGRVTETTERLFPDVDTRPPVIQAVPGYIKAGEQEGAPLPGFEVLWKGDRDGVMPVRGWAAESSKRYLAGAIVVGTVDQVLLSALQVSHAHMRAAALLRHFLVVDEVHASDAYMTALMDLVLDQHLAAGGHALLMSATLGASARAHLTTAGRQAPPPLEEAVEEAYPLLTHVDASRREPKSIHAASAGHEKHVETELRGLAGDPEAVAQLAAAKAHAGGRVLIIRNLVADCRATQRALEEVVGDAAELLFAVGGTPAPHHSRFAPEDRERLDARIEALFGKERTGNGGVVAVATQTVEQSLDIDADLLITDLCPVDVLLQRIGRLHRHRRARPEGFEAARCIVLTPEKRDLSDAIVDDGRGLKGPHGLGTVYDDLRVIEATWQVLEGEGPHPWRIPEHNRELVERATHPDRLHAVAEVRGEAWDKHQQHIIGQQFADRDHSQYVGLQRTLPFGDDRNAFAKDLGKVQTRLGEETYRVKLPEPVPGPFGKDIDELTLSAWQLEGVAEHLEPEEEEAKDVRPEEGGFRFSFCGRRFGYGRMGIIQERKA